ncbi:3-dehydroquinate synthase [Micrococcales bacterium 31B]|nr:3-dehydroquinate synthase [Micrococcales bacterium 31B]
MTDTTTIRVSGPHPYDVVVGRGLLDSIGALVPESVQRVLVIHPKALATTGETVLEALRARGLEAYVAEVPDAEEAKTAQVLAFLWGVLGQAGFTRSDLIVGIGGGATTDLAGFAAATWMRGIGFINVPTTLLGMVDAAVGGKTGINTAEGKNLVGAFHEPLGVVCDLDSLRSLPTHDLLAGMAEVVKAGFIRDTRILDIVETSLAAATDPTTPEFAELVVRSIQVKADVVGVDLKESGLREILNYGHTLAHAIETVERYQWRHGAAVSVGMMFVAELSRLEGKLSEADVDRHRNILTSLGLPVTYRGDKWHQLLDVMKRDKKTRGDLLRFVVLDAIGRPTRLEGPDLSLLFTAYQEIASDAPASRAISL